MESVRSAINTLYQQYDFAEEQDEMALFIVKIITLKLLIDKGRITLDAALGRRLRADFTIHAIMAQWDKESEKDDWGSVKKRPISQKIWEDILAFIQKTESFKDTDTEILGDIYETCLHLSHRKHHGIFYTPKGLARSMAKRCLSAYKTEKVIDPACGSGVLLNAAYNHTMACASNQNSEATHRELLANRLYGVDKDAVAVLVTRLTLTLKSDCYCYPAHIYQGDALIDDMTADWSNTFDVILANPPYVGHKEIDTTYRKRLKEKYAAVYQDKSDLSYCFFALGHQLLKDKGRLLFLTSRYYMESRNARWLREFITQNFSINAIVDFNGLRVIEGVGIDPALTFLTKGEPATQHSLKVQRFFVRKGKSKESQVYFDDLQNAKPRFHEAFTMRQQGLDQEIWRLYSPETQKLIGKIEAKAPFTLENLVESFQGMITGNDRVFIFDDAILEEYNFHPELLHPWIKNKDVRAFHVARPSKHILYTDAIKQLEAYPYEEVYLKQYQDTLMQRRECRNGVRKWYQIQWGRVPALFEQRKIVFPYKATGANFAIDEVGCYFSADVYGMVLKNRLYSQINEEFLVLLLNSKLYDFYFKSFAKKLGMDLYEYYPNTLLKLKIPEVDTEEASHWKAQYDKIVNLECRGDREAINALKSTFDDWLYAHFGLTDAEIKIIKA